MPEKKLKVSGVAVRAGLSLNGILYTPEELAKFSPTLADRPILKDHFNISDKTVGLVGDTAFNNATTEVNYEGWVKEDGTNLLEKIKDRRLKEVSIGAVVGRLVKENLDDDFFIAKDIKAMELSITPTPANVGTSITATLKGLKEATNPNDLKQVKPIFEKINDFNKDYVQSLKPMVVSESRQMVETKTIEKFVCPMCEDDLPSIEDLRKHMKVHNQEPREEEHKEKIKNKNTEDTKMPEEQTVNVKIDTKEVEDKLKQVEAKTSENEAKESEIKTKVSDLEAREKVIQEKEDTMAKKNRERLEKEYKETAEAKKVDARDISKLSDETVSELTEQLKLIAEVEEPATPVELAKEEPAAESEKKDETKGQVGSSKEDESINDTEGYVFQKSEFGNGYSIYRETYDPKYKKLLAN